MCLPPPATTALRGTRSLISKPAGPSPAGGTETGPGRPHPAGRRLFRPITNITTSPLSSSHQTVQQCSPQLTATSRPMTDWWTLSWLLLLSQVTLYPQTLWNLMQGPLRPLQVFPESWTNPGPNPREFNSSYVCLIRRNSSLLYPNCQATFLTRVIFSMWYICLAYFL